MGHIIAQPGKFSGRAFVIVLSLEFVVFGVLALAKARFCIKWLECQWEAACLYSFPDKMAFLDFGRCLGWCGVGAKWQFYRGSRMIAAFSVLFVLGDSLGQPLQFSGFSFVIVSSLEVVFCTSENKVVGCRV